MIGLINNEFNKVKKIRLIFSQILIIISIYVMYRVSDKDIYELVFNIIPIIGIFVSIFFSGSICGELERGNLRYYLTKPVKRWKIYLSKLICIYIYIHISLLFVIITCCILKKNIDGLFIGKYMTYSIPIFFIGIFVLYLSTKFKSQSLCTGVSIFLFSFSLIISQVLFGIKFNIIEYTFFPYLDFSLFDDLGVLKNMNNELGIHLSMKRGIIIDIIYGVLLYIRGNFLFIKKDIRY
ncbi:MAG: ABC transporter permease subunit [Bacilli bacterium]|nr:ABC transporter permease subunit [Bacilli bacterium]